MIKKLVIFDCDGTLVDSEHLCNLGLSQQLSEVGVNMSAQTLVERYRGVEFNVILAELQNELGFIAPSDFEQQYRAKVSKLFDAHLKPIEGVEDVVAALSLTKCVASSAPRHKIEHSLTATGLRRYFDDNIFSCYEIGAWKPKPDIFLHAAKQMGFAPEDCYVVEDSLVGIQAATAAGMTCFYYCPEGATASQFGEIPFSSMTQLPTLIA